MVSFISCSTFGRYALRALMETRSTYMSMQLLNVPVDIPGDRSQWTWDLNWKNYVVPGAFSSGTNAQNFLSTGGSPVVNIDLILSGNQPGPGAYYDGLAYDNERYMAIYNPGPSDFTYTHAAIFTNQTTQASFNSNAPLLGESLVAVIPDNSETEESTTLSANTSFLFPCAVEDAFGAYGGTAVCLSETFETWFSLYFSDTPFVSTEPSPFITLNNIIVDLEDFAYQSTAYFQNQEGKKYIVDTYKNLLGVSDATPTPTFLAELLNVTGSEPEFDEDWSAWETYRINQYALAIPEQRYQHEDKSVYAESDGVGATITGTQIKLQNNTEFVFLPPGAGSFTYTHIAVFINVSSSQPLNGSTYTYADTTKFVGVIKLDSSVTLSSTSIARAYPFNFSLMVQPLLEFTDAGS